MKQSLWYGIPAVHLIDRGNWSDAALRYRGWYFNESDVWEFIHGWFGDDQEYMHLYDAAYEGKENAKAAEKYAAYMQRHGCEIKNCLLTYMLHSQWTKEETIGYWEPRALLRKLRKTFPDEWNKAAQRLKHGSIEEIWDAVMQERPY